MERRRVPTKVVDLDIIGLLNTARCCAAPRHPLSDSAQSACVLNGIGLVYRYCYYTAAMYHILRIL